MSQQQPTWEDLNRLEAKHRKLEEEVHQLREQMTEPMRPMGIEPDQGNVMKRLDAIQADTHILNIKTDGAIADTLRIRESQADLRDRLIDHSAHLQSIEEKQEAHTEVLGRILSLTESHDRHMATKEDISRLEQLLLQLVNRPPQPE